MNFKSWKIVTVGHCKSVSAYRDELDCHRFVIDNETDYMLGKINVLRKQTQVDLIKATIAELGFKGSTRTNQIFLRIKEFGYRLCRAEIAPALCLAYYDQPMINLRSDESLNIAMKPIVALYDELCIFCMGRDGDYLLLGNTLGNPGRWWTPDEAFIFVHPRK